MQLAQTEPGSCGESEITVVPLAGGRTLFSINDPCRARQAVSFTYAGIPFQRALDAHGRLDFTLDCFAGDGTPVAIAFQDGSGQNITLPFSLKGFTAALASIQ